MRTATKIKIILSLLFFPLLASAHEAYVLPSEEFHEGLMKTELSAFRVLSDPTDLKMFLIITAVILLALLSYFWFEQTQTGDKFDSWWASFEKISPLIVRIAVGVSFILSALDQSFLGPEIPLTNLIWPEFLRSLLLISGGLMLVGMFSELAALIGLGIYLIAFFKIGSYVFTYTNYLGEFLVLIFLGSRVFSLDEHMFGVKKKFQTLKKYESLIVRVGYGLALIFAAITVKLLHPNLTVDVVETYHLTKFSWLFPHDPLLITLGAALAEMGIGILILMGITTRLVVFVSMIYITMSLIYFRELVWPHLLLYGISINLLINNGGPYTLSNYLRRRNKTRR